MKENDNMTDATRKTMAKKDDLVRFDLNDIVSVFAFAIGSALFEAETTRGLDGPDAVWIQSKIAENFNHLRAGELIFGMSRAKDDEKADAVFDLTKSVTI